MQKTADGKVSLNNDPVGDHKTYRKMLTDWKDDLTALLPPGGCADNFMRTAINVWANTPQLRNAAKITVLNALAISAQLGLRPNGVGGEGWVACYKAHWLPEGVLEATFLTGYQGAIKLMMNHPDVVAINAKAVCEHEVDDSNGYFDFQDGTETYIDHQIGLKGKRGEPVGAYGIAWLKGAPKPIFVVLTKEEIDRRRDITRDRESRLWSDYKDVGYMKTAIFSLAKLIPKSSQMALAIELDHRYEQGKPAVDLGPINDPAHSATGTSRTDALAKQLNTKN